MFGKPPWEDFFPDFDDLLPIGKIFDTSISEKIKREVKSVIGNEMKPKVGSVLHCSLLQTVEHTGIYVGWNKVVHLNGDGIIEKVSYAEFCWPRQHRVDKFDAYKMYTRKRPEMIVSEIKSILRSL